MKHAHTHKRAQAPRKHHTSKAHSHTQSTSKLASNYYQRNPPYTPIHTATPRIVIIGRANVGKSSLFNRLAKHRLAITSHIAGTTRDIRATQIHLHANFKQAITQALQHTSAPITTQASSKHAAQRPLNAPHNTTHSNNQRQKARKSFSKKQDYPLDTPSHIATLIDTGGIGEKEDLQNELYAQITQKALESAQKATLIIFLVDGQKPPTNEDRKLFFTLHALAPTLLVINKIDNDAQKAYSYAFASFGAKEYYCISVAHNRGISILLRAITKRLFPLTHIAQEDELLTSLENMRAHALHTKLESKATYHLDASSLASALDASPSLSTPSTPSIEPMASLSCEESQTSTASSPPPLIHPPPLIQVGIIGRVNVGKSSLLNALVGSNRSIVSPIAGTTIDPVDEEICFENAILRFIDTAGIRRKGQIQSLEKFALERTRAILERAHIAILVLDASAPLVELDEKLFSLIQEYGLGIIIVWNKWDIAYADFATIKADFLRRFRFLEYAPFLTLSALTKRHITELKRMICAIYANYSFRIPTAKLNEAIANATRAHPIPSDKGKLVKIYYATQYGTHPPQIALICNRPHALHFSYKRFLINWLRKAFSFHGVPIILTLKGKHDNNAMSS